MSYNAAIPGANDLISQSQSQIQTNFSQANTIFGQDHVEFDNATAANRGKHNFSTYIEQSVDPTTVANEIALYSKDVSSATRLFLAPESAGSVYQFTGPNPSVGTNGEGYWPGLLLFKYGNFTTSGATTVITYSTLVPALTAFPNATFTVILTPINATGVGNFRISSTTSSSFTVVAPTISSFYFFAIGN